MQGAGEPGSRGAKGVQMRRGSRLATPIPQPPTPNTTYSTVTDFARFLG